MNNQQNIEDILKLLKSSYGDEASGENDSEKTTPVISEKDRDISHEELQEKLKAQFMTDAKTDSDSGGYEAEPFAYNIDDGFLESATELEDAAEADESSVAETPAVDEQIAEDLVEADSVEHEEAIIEAVESDILEETTDDDDGVPPFDIEEAVSDDIYEDEEEIFEDLNDDLDDGEDGIFVEDENGEIVIVQTKDNNPENTENNHGIYSLFVKEETATDERPTDIEEDVQDEEIELFSGEDGQLAMFEDSVDSYDEDSSASVEEESIASDDQIAIDFGGNDEMGDSEYEINGDGAEIDDSMLALMYELGDVSVVDKSVGSERVAAYLSHENEKAAKQINPADAFAFDGEEYERAEQTEELLDAYRREKLFTLLRVMGGALFAMLLMAYEFVTLLGEVSGIFSYDEYPTAYMLISLQLLVCSAAFAWRELFSGLKKAFTFKVGRWSSVALVLIFTVIYDIAIMFIGFEDRIYLFGSIASLYILLGLVSEYLEVCREIKSFKIYSSDEKKFTFDTKGRPGSSADKMYQGGISRSKKVFEPREIEFPNRYFSAVNTNERVDWSLNYSIIPIIVLSTLALLVNIMFGEEADTALAMFMLMFTALVPVSAFAKHIFPMFRMSSRLYERDAAIAGEEMAYKYAACDYIIFKDMHLFKQATPHDNGIVIYDDRRAGQVIEYLGALYDVIGGPMKGVFGDGAGESHSVRLRRVARNGVEAVLDGAHSLILGDAAFVGRYGINFAGRDTVGVGEGIMMFAIDGRPAAKLCLKYRTEPVFEMLVSKLSEEGVRCAIETYDPAINGSFVATCRKNKFNPINVIHKNVFDYYKEPNFKLEENTGLVVCSSRLKLVECVVWCKRIRKVWKISSVMQIIMSGIIALGLSALILLESTEYVNQYSVFLAQLVCMIPTFIAMGAKFPSKDHFTSETVYRHTSKGQVKKEKKEAEKTNE